MPRLPVHAIVLAALLASCSTPKETEVPPARTEPGSEFRRYEATFAPSDYDSLPGVVTPTVVRPSAPADTSATVAPEIPSDEMESGYRVQIFASTSIDEANAKKLAAQKAIPEEWFYLEYDPPTYKVRGGNFEKRFDAERFVTVLHDRGFPGAWVVPERVFVHPPPPSVPADTLH